MSARHFCLNCGSINPGSLTRIHKPCPVCQWRNTHENAGAFACKSPKGFGPFKKALITMWYYHPTRTLTVREETGRKWNENRETVYKNIPPRTCYTRLPSLLVFS